MTATFIPLLGFGFAGYSSTLTTHRAWDGMVAGAVAGVLSGAIAGLLTVRLGR